jgi:hypothetical protein
MKDFDDALSPDSQDPVLVAERDDTHDDVDRIQQLLKELDLTGGVARVFRQRPGRTEYDYEGEIPVDSFSLETIKRVYGGGRYQIKLTAKNGKYVRQVKVSVDPRHKGEIEKSMDSTMSAAPGSNNDLVAFLLKAQQDQQDRAMQSQQQMMTLMVTMLTESQKATATMMAAAFQREPVNVTPQEPASRLIEVMTPFLLQQMQSPRPTSSLAELVENLKVVKELAAGEPPREEKEEDMLEKVVKIGAPLIGAFMSRGQPMPQVPPQMIQRPTIPQQASTPPSTPPSATDDAAKAAVEAKMRSLLGQLRMVTPILVRAAKRNSPIESYLDILDDTLDEEGFQLLTLFLEREDWVTTLFSDDDGVKANLSWFENFREMILNPSDDEGEETPKDQAPSTTSPFGVVP